MFLPRELQGSKDPEGFLRREIVQWMCLHRPFQDLYDGANPQWWTYPIADLELAVGKAQTEDYGHEKSFFEGLIQVPTSYLHITDPGMKLQDCVAPASAAVQRQIPPQ